MIDNLSWIAAYPEIMLLVMSCLIALVDLGVRSPLRGATYLLTLATLGCLAVLLGMEAASGRTIEGFGGMIVSDPMGNWLKCFATIALMVTLVYGRAYAGARDMLRGGELFTLSMFALLGMFVMISGHNFLVIYLGLELLTLSSYALVALRRDDLQATEAAMKYFVLGALASGFLLYGLSMVYGATGSLGLSEVLAAIRGGEDTLKGSAQVLVLGLVFVVAGLALLFWLSDSALYLLKIALGISVVGSAALLVMRFEPKTEIDPPASFALTGLLAGLMGGMFSTAGPPLVYKLYRQPLSLPVIRQALLVMFGLSQLVRLGIVLITGQFTPASITYAVLAVPLLFLVTRYNRRYPLKLSSMAVSRVAAGLLLMAGASLIATSL